MGPASYPTKMPNVLSNDPSGRNAVTSLKPSATMILPVPGSTTALPPGSAVTLEAIPPTPKVGSTTAPRADAAPNTASRRNPIADARGAMRPPCPTISLGSNAASRWIRPGSPASAAASAGLSPSRPEPNMDGVGGRDGATRCGTPRCGARRDGGARADARRGRCGDGGARRGGRCGHPQHVGAQEPRRERRERGGRPEPDPDTVRLREARRDGAGGEVGRQGQLDARRRDGRQPRREGAELGDGQRRPQGQRGQHPRMGEERQARHARRAAQAVTRYDGDTPFAFSSSSITSLNFSNGCAPDSMRPLMKNAGVPLTPTFEPSAMSLSMAALNCLSARH